jgi:hypothetical protein
MSINNAAMWDTAFSLYGTVVNASSFGASPSITTNEIPINQALQAVNAKGGGTVLLDPGDFVTSGTIVIPGDYITLKGSNWNTVLMPIATGNFDVIATPLPPSASIPGYVINYMTLQDFSIDMSLMYNAGNGIIQGQGNAIHTYGLKYSKLERLFIKRSPNWAMLFDGDLTNFSFDTIIKECIFDLCNANIYGSTAEAYDFVENRFKWCGSATNALQPLFQAPDQVAQHLRCKSGYQYIAGNIFGNGGTYTTEAILLSNNGPCRVIGNRFDQVRFQAIKLQGGNHMFAFNQLGSPVAQGGTRAIQLGSSNNIVMGNKFDNTAGAVQYTYAVEEAGGPFTNNIVAHNSLLVGLTGFVNFNATSTPLVWNNPPYNPVGFVTTPGFPATTVAVTNNTGGWVTAYIVNGTSAITQIVVGGTNTNFQIVANGFGNIRIPPNSTISFTYAAGAPAWKWFVE